MFPEIDSPALLVDDRVLEENLRAMQARCDAAGVALWPHAKTHKTVEILRRQLALGAAGATCAKIGEAEALLESGVRRIFLSSPLVDPAKAERLRALCDRLDEVILAVTSAEQARALDGLLRRAGLRVPVLLGVDTGLGREGTRTVAQTARLAEWVRAADRMDLRGVFTHEGHGYQCASPEDVSRVAEDAWQRLTDHAAAAGVPGQLWPGCSVTAAEMVGRKGVAALRPGTYALGDLSLGETPGVRAALTILATVLDRPEPGLALIDAGSKVFSSDRTREGIFGRCQDLPSVVVHRLSEEQGWVSGEGVDDLVVGQRLRFVPAHVCPVVNLADRLHRVRDGARLEVWRVAARGRSD